MRFESDEKTHKKFTNIDIVKSHVMQKFSAMQNKIEEGRSKVMSVSLPATPGCTSSGSAVDGGWPRDLLDDSILFGRPRSRSRTPPFARRSLDNAASEDMHCQTLPRQVCAMAQPKEDLVVAELALSCDRPERANLGHDLASPPENPIFAARVLVPTVANRNRWCDSIRCESFRSELRLRSSW